MLKIDKKLHWSLSNSSLIVYQDTWHYTSQWPSRQRQRQRQQEGWSSAPSSSLGEVFVRFARFFPQISWHLVFFITDPLIVRVFANLFRLKCIDNFVTNTCRRNPSVPHAAPLRWLKTVFRLKSWQNQYRFSSTVAKRWFGEVQCDLFYLEKAGFVFGYQHPGLWLLCVCHFDTLKVHFYSLSTL